MDNGSHLHLQKLQFIYVISCQEAFDIGSKSLQIRDIICGKVNFTFPRLSCVRPWSLYWLRNTREADYE